jgi:hypothetical protein
VGYSGSITAIKRDHGTTRSMSAKNLSRPVRFFLHRVLGAGKAALVHLGGAVTCGGFTHARAVPAATY